MLRPHLLQQSDFKAKPVSEKESDAGEHQITDREHEGQFARMLFKHATCETQISRGIMRHYNVKWCSNSRLSFRWNPGGSCRSLAKLRSLQVLWRALTKFPSE